MSAWKEDPFIFIAKNRFFDLSEFQSEDTGWRFPSFAFKNRGYIQR